MYIYCKTLLINIIIHLCGYIFINIYFYKLNLVLWKKYSHRIKKNYEGYCPTPKKNWF